MDRNAETVFTIGHGTRDIEDFIDILSEYRIRCLVDVRSIPRSRHNPQFNKGKLPGVLEINKIGYRHVSELGGFRRPRADSPNDGWRNEGFRGFADYMSTDVFEQALKELAALSQERRTALMCAETLPWRCHRSLIADVLVLRGISVDHLLRPGTLQHHRITSWAQVDGLRLTYPSRQCPDGPPASSGLV
jgi:uncharacterized protein (DUF488 family)